MLENLLEQIGRSAPAAWQPFIKERGFRRYFYNTGWMMGGQIFSLAMSFLVGAWVARYLGPDNYGFFSYSLSFAGLFSMIAGLGVDGILSRDLVRYPEKSSVLLGSGLAIKAASGFIAWLAATVAAWWLIPDGLGRILVSLIALSYIFSAFNIIDIFFRSRVESRYSVKAQILTAVIGSALKAAVILSGQGLVWLVGIYALEVLIQGAILTSIYLGRHLPVGRWQVSSTMVRKLLASSWPLLLSGLSSFVLLKIDQVMIGSYLSSAAVGLYAAGVKLTEVWYFIPGVICASLFPAIINARTADLGQYHRRLKRLYVFLLVLAILIALPLSWGADFFIRQLFGAAYLGAAPAAAVYVWSTLGWFLVSALWYRFMAENRLGLIFWSSFLPMIANILLNIWLIPRFGILGAAWATLISYSSMIIFIFYPSRHEDLADNN